MRIETVKIAGIEYEVDMDLDPEMMACVSNSRHDMRVKGVPQEYLENVRSIHVFIYVTRCQRCNTFRTQSLDADHRPLPGTTRYDYSQTTYKSEGYTQMDSGTAKIWELGFDLITKREQNRVRRTRKIMA